MVYDDHREPSSDDRSVAELVEELSAEVKRLVRDELTLAVAEMRRKGMRYGLGAGLGGAAAVAALFGGGALVVAAILALALIVPGWVAALVVGGGLLLTAGALALAGRKSVAKAGAPVPTEAVESVRADVASAKESLRR
ncbi:putative Holin-X, holin superfamily III [Prauserella aidingensis]|uniref:phage holin family protein n=1 Tax=Prauserella aidingensis TaxID=387890 RepID=UPI0020A5CE09|nr:phage holin family protein [Prauserella aidingensis]MCP2252745.1 putative Holin-X, holin superfamily III [Prauserella aidingensis]